MKKIFVAVTLLLLASNSNACSICGCGGGNLYIGMYPIFDSKFIGIRYNYSDYKTVLQNDPTQYSKNTYTNYEIWAGANLSKKWQLFAILPYQYNKQLSDDGNNISQGIGDLTLLTNYQILNQRKVVNNKKLILHQLWIGGGLKLKTGKFEMDVHDPNATLAIANAQMGTGSTDFLFNFRDVYQVENWGLASNVNYKINTSNGKGYQYGNKLMFSSTVFYNLNFKEMSIIPNAGIQFENLDGNKLDGQLISLSEGLDSGAYYTGGHCLNLQTGIETNLRKISLGFNFQLPIQQNFAASQTNLNWKGSIHLTYNF